MAGNDGTTTELFTGWSSVVHQPEDEPEESELPSTVDIGALSAEPIAENPAQNEAESDSSSEDSEADSSNSDVSDGSQDSCSHSDSSDSDSSSSSQDSSSRSASPEFSVTSSQTDGLRLTIATVRKSISSPIQNNAIKQSEAGQSDGNSKKIKNRKKSTSSSSSSSNCSSDSDTNSDSDSNLPAKKLSTINGTERKIPSATSNNNNKSRVITANNAASSLKNNKPSTALSSVKTRGNYGVNQKESSNSTKSKSSTGIGGSTLSGIKKKDVIKEPIIPNMKSSRVSLNLNNNSNNTGNNKDNLFVRLRSCTAAPSHSKESSNIGRLRNAANNRESLNKSRSLSTKENGLMVSDSSNSSFNLNNSAKGNKQDCDSSTHSIKEKFKEAENNSIISANDRGINISSSKEGRHSSGRKKVRLKRKAKKMSSLPLSRSSNYSSSDSDSSDELLSASCSLQEIRQEDLAAILPDQSECNDFNDFDQNNKDSPTTGDLSGSDMELPQQAINSLIQRTTESSSDGEGHQLPNPQTLFANSLLQQFVPNNPLVGSVGDQSAATSTNESSVKSSLHIQNNNSSMSESRNDNFGDSHTGNVSTKNGSGTMENSNAKRGRGRPKRSFKHANDEKSLDRNMQDFCGAPNVSPDSGIQNSPDHGSSPEPSLSPTVRLSSSSQNKDLLKKSCNLEARSRNMESLRNKMHHSSHNRNPSGERHSKRLLSQERQRTTSSEDNQGKSRRNKDVSREQRMHALKGQLNNNKSSDRTSSRNSSQENLLRNKLTHQVHSSRNSSKEKFSGSSRNSSIEKVKGSVSKVSMTSNQFDRILYGHADRVLYPPRRRAGRPAIKKLGRSTKHKSESSQSKSLPLQTVFPTTKASKCKNKSPTNNKSSSSTNSKSMTLKVPKIFHSKHTQKHKKRKFKIMKPMVSFDPKINQEIEKLVGDFSKHCMISSKPAKETVSEQVVKNLKKVTKKRRTTEHLEKKKKKQHINTAISKLPNSNEQRLPLKKRHYHLVSNSSENQKIELNDEIREKTEKGDDVKANKVEKKEKTKEKDNKTAPKQVLITKNHTNNNEYEIKAEKCDVDLCTEVIDEAKSSDKESTKVEEILSDNKAVTATTPKKRHRLENLNADTEDISSDCQGTQDVIKDEIPILKLEEKLEKHADSPISVESYINELKVKRNLLNQKSTEDTEKKVLVENNEEEQQIKREITNNVKVEKSIAVSPESTKKKVRKRRAFNRTGFPTVKKKKKKPIAENTEIPMEESKDTDKLTECDRVPKDGEEINKFLQRSSSNNTIIEDFTDINDIPSPPENDDDDVISDCESLPLNERIDVDLDADNSSRSESALDNASETNNKLDNGDSETLSLLESSIERLKSRLDQKKRKRSKDLTSLLETSNAYPKRKKREDSPASSIGGENKLKDNASLSGDEIQKKNKKAPSWRKKYLVAGLFSDFYKDEVDTKKQDLKTRNLVYIPEEHPHGLLPAPLYCGKRLRTHENDFQLPLELWWQHTHSQLPGRDLVPSWNYRKIRTNVYNVKNNGGACEPQSCNCKATSNCGDDCINRLVLAECPSSHRCLNQRIQKHDWAPGIEKFMTEEKGWGVRTREPIKQSEFILEYVGEVVSDQEFKERMNSIYVKDTHHYCLHLDSGLVIDGHRMGGDGRFVNHSCEPNCEMQKWTVNGQFRMALFALRDIKPYEEISYDYNFSLFNAAEGQPCKCRSTQCRGVIGGKSQRIRQLPETTVQKVPGRIGRPRKTEAKKKLSGSNKEQQSSSLQSSAQIIPHIQVKPMSHQQKCFILERHCFLLRNLTKVRKVRDRSSQSVVASSNTTLRQNAGTPTNTSTFMSQLNALQNPRNMKTRKIAQAEDDPELNKTIKLATILKNILEEITSAKGDNNEELSVHLQQLPSKRKSPEFYQKIQDAIDLATIEQNVATGIYKTADAFDEDMNKLFNGFSKFYGRTHEIGIATTKLKKLFNETKQKSLAQFQDVLGQKPPPNFVKNRRKNEEEDIIRCICGIPMDEGLMIQCERCMVWQHIECVQVDAAVASYHCEICVPRKVDYEITMDDFTEHGHRYYMTLMRGELQLRQGDTVYVLRDITIPGTEQKHTYETIGKIDYTELDIFRIERLWKDKDTGKRYAYGHHYLRPHETFHEPTRKFFPNEVMRVPLYEAVPVELIMECCWVMDINSYCKGRPIGSQEEHVYICEYRVDKAAKMFSKVAKSKFPICTKSFAFERFESRLKVSRTYCPHDVDESMLKNGGVGRRKMDKEKDKSSSINNNGSTLHIPPSVAATCVPKTRAEQKARLNKILLNLLSKVPTKQIIDVSYLLEGGRRRKKQETKQ